MNIKNVSIDKVKNNKNVKAVDAPKGKRGRPALPWVPGKGDTFARVPRLALSYCTSLYAPS
jgi:hypothetical protein